MEAKQLIEGRESWHAWVIDYGITHSIMRIALHQGDFPRHHELVCGGVSFFRGPLQGGPYRLRIEIAPGQSGPHTLRDDAGQFEVVCSSIDVGVTRR
jgi:hypothetical protein